MVVRKIKSNLSTHLPQELSLRLVILQILEQVVFVWIFEGREPFPRQFCCNQFVDHYLFLLPNPVSPVACLTLCRRVPPRIKKRRHQRMLNSIRFLLLLMK